MAGNPDTAVVKTGGGDGACFTLYFLCELNSTDYLRRIIAQVGYTLRPVYKDLTQCGLAKVAVSGHTLVPYDPDAYAILRHIRQNMREYESHLGLSPNFLKDIAQWPKKAQNQLVRGTLAGVSKEYANEAFAKAQHLVVAARI